MKPFSRCALLSLLQVTLGCQARQLVVDVGGGGDFATNTAAAATAGPGDVVTVRPGVYRETLKLSSKHGTAGRPILIQADPNAPVGSVILDGSRPAPPEN